MLATVPSITAELGVEGNADVAIEGAGERPRSRVALALATVTGAAAVGLTIVSWPFVSPAFRKVCLPYVPATSEQVTNVLRALKGRTGPLVDLGSGDGRIVIAAAAVGFRSTGVELNPWLVLWSRLWARRERLAPLATFRRADLFSVDLGSYQNVVIFGVRQMMPRLEVQLSRQLPMTGCVVACRFPLPTWRPSHVYGEGADTVWVYFRPTPDNEDDVAGHTSFASHLSTHAVPSRESDITSHSSTVLAKTES